MTNPIETFRNWGSLFEYKASLSAGILGGMEVISIADDSRKDGIRFMLLPWNFKNAGGWVDRFLPRDWDRI